ncbi:MAG TPA: apolipoprotein N-acyltransferase [Myxococcota bacterium]|nr:apolipoprotein N-acyltransferase [Myxococcota bacterium]
MTRLGLSLAFAALFALSFAFRAGDVFFDVGPVAAWAAAAPLWLLLRDAPPRAAFGRAFLAAWLGYACVFWWLFIVITVYGKAPAAAGVAGTLGVAAYCALCLALGAAAAAALRPWAGPAAALLLPAAWILADRVRALESVAAFPWAFLGYAAHADPPLRGLASLCGVYGLSFVYALSGVWLAERRWPALAALVLGAHALGWLALPGALAPADTPPIHVAMIQGNIPQSEKWDPDFESHNFAAQLELSREALASDPPDLLLWPEAAVPGFLLDPGDVARYPFLADSQREFRDPLLALARDRQVPLLVGALALTPVPGQRMPNVYNSAFTITPRDGLADRHDKTVLVPFGEYIPARWLLFGSLSAVASGVANLGDVTPGDGVRRLRGMGRLGEHAPAVLICYEVVYPGVVSRAVREGARLLINITNDAWYGRSSAPHQFLAIAQLRSAEHGLPMLRDANTGVSALIDAGGAVLSETPIFERHVLAGEVPRARASATPYSRIGDWPLWLCAASFAFLGGRAVVGRRRR